MDMRLSENEKAQQDMINAWELKLQALEKKHATTSTTGSAIAHHTKGSRASAVFTMIVGGINRDAKREDRTVREARGGTVRGTAAHLRSGYFLFLSVLGGSFIAEGVTHNCSLVFWVGSFHRMPDGSRRQELVAQPTTCRSVDLVQVRQGELTTIGLGTNINNRRLVALATVLRHGLEAAYPEVRLGPWAVI